MIVPLLAKPWPLQDGAGLPTEASMVVLEVVVLVVVATIALVGSGAVALDPEGKSQVASVFGLQRPLPVLWSATVKTAEALTAPSAPLIVKLFVVLV